MEYYSIIECNKRDIQALGIHGVIGTHGVIGIQGS